MSNLRDIHGEQYNPPHIGCPDLYCCKCECQTCKRAWFAAGRPHPKDCPEHGKAPEAPPAARKSAWDHVREGLDDE